MAICSSAWCGKCYMQMEDDKFPVLTAQDLEDEAIVNDEEMVEEDDPLRFKEGRDGDHLVCPFQCDVCHFVNMRKRVPIEGRQKDELTLLCIRRANLDSLWARERSTVAKNRREGVRYLEIESRLCDDLEEDDGGYPERGPWPIKDVFGMRLACSMLLRSLDPGQNAKTIQFETLRKLRSHMSNFIHTCPGGTGATFVGEDSNASTLSRSFTNGLWFRRFSQGCHRRMGDVWLPDRPVTIDVLKGALNLLEGDWLAYANDPVGQINTGLTACMLIAGFFAALRGEEIVRVDISAMLLHWNESTNMASSPHVPLMLVGRFKREIGEKIFTQPLAGMSKSGVNIMEWFHRTLTLFHAKGVTTGPMFRNAKKQRASVSELDVMLHSILERVQNKWSNLIPDAVNVKEEYSCLRSLRRGATAEAQNAGIPAEVINANNRWRKHCRSRGLLPSMSMMDRYTDAKASVPALIRFSGGL